MSSFFGKYQILLTGKDKKYLTYSAEMCNTKMYIRLDYRFTPDSGYRSYNSQRGCEMPIVSFTHSLTSAPIRVDTAKIHEYYLNITNEFTIVKLKDGEEFAVKETPLEIDEIVFGDFGEK